MTLCKTLLRAYVLAHLAQEDRIQLAGKVVGYTVGESWQESHSTLRTSNYPERAAE
jgi:hypothetical protein